MPLLLKNEKKEKQLTRYVNVYVKIYIFCFQYFASLNSQNKEVFGHLEATSDATL